MSGTCERTFSVSVSLERAETVADPILHLETGVGFARHPMERSFHGIRARGTPSWIRDGELHGGAAVLGPRPIPQVVAP